MTPALVVVDSIQAVFDPGVAGTPGSLGQVRACTDLVVHLAKSIACRSCWWAMSPRKGPWPAPVPWSTSSTPCSAWRGTATTPCEVRATKHRFGPTGELGLFEMNDAGLAAVTDPSGSCWATAVPGRRERGGPAMQGQRPCWSRSRPVTSKSTPEMPAGARRRESTAVGWRCCWRCSSSAPGCR